MSDLVVVHPNARGAYAPELRDVAAVETPVWAGLIATYVKCKGLEVRLVDAEAEQLTDSQLQSRVAGHEPLVVAIVAYGHHPSASTQTMPAVFDAARAVRAGCPKAIVVLVGGHVAALPNRTATESTAADAVCTGEGPVTVHDLVRYARREIRLSEVRGILGGPPAPNVQELDRDMLSPAWEMMPMGLYRAHNWHALGQPSARGYASLYTSLGCPFSCSFCCIQAPFRSGDRVGEEDGANSYRRWSPEAVVENLARLRHGFGVRNIKVADEMFVLNRRHVEAICDGVVKANLTDLNMWAYARTDTVPPGLEKKLKAAGFNWLAFGVESGEVAIRNGALKTLDSDDIRETLGRVRDAGINVIANYIFGLPGETAETMCSTLELAQELNTEFANFYCAMAYPGSLLYEQAGPMDLPHTWAGYSQLGTETMPLPTDTLSPKQVLAFRDHAFREYHSSPRYLSMLKERLGERAAASIFELAGRKISRRILE